MVAGIVANLELLQTARRTDILHIEQVAAEQRGTVRVGAGNVEQPLVGRLEVVILVDPPQDAFHDDIVRLQAIELQRHLE